MVSTCAKEKHADVVDGLGCKQLESRLYIRPIGNKSLPAAQQQKIFLCE